MLGVGPVEEAFLYPQTVAAEVQVSYADPRHQLDDDLARNEALRLRARASSEAPGKTSIQSPKSSATMVARDCNDALVIIIGSRNLVVRLPDLTHFSRRHYRPWAYRTRRPRHHLFRLGRAGHPSCRPRGTLSRLR